MISLRETIDRAIKLADEIANLGAALRSAKEEYTVLIEDTIPEMLITIGVDGVSYPDGMSVSSRVRYRGLPAAKNMGDAVAWLNSVGSGAIVDTRFVIDVSDIPADILVEIENAITPEHKIHWATLGSVVAEHIAAGHEVPLDTLGVRAVQYANIKTKGN